MDRHPTIVLENGLDLRQVLTTGSILNINEDNVDTENDLDADRTKAKEVDLLGRPVESFGSLEKRMVSLDPEGFVKKKIIDEGGGQPLHDGCTVSIAFSGYWENESEPFDTRMIHKLLIVDLKENGLLPGLQTAVRSMLVGETSVFLLSYKVMYGEMGIPPRVKPKADCVFYIKLLKSVLTSKDRKIDFSEPNIFGKVHHEVKLLYSSGVTLHKNMNSLAATQLFRKGVYILHKCRLANEEEQKVQEKLLIKLYTNLAICYNKIEQPLKACTACNELNRLNSLWNNGKALFQNAKALRMIGRFDVAEKRLNRAMKLCPDNKEIEAEFILLKQTRDACNQDKLFVSRIAGSLELIDNDFKKEVDSLIKNFKENVNLCKLTLPSGLNSTEVAYIKEVCIRENLFCNKIGNNYALDRSDKDEIDNDKVLLDL